MQGCNTSCLYCDTTYAQDPDGGSDTSIDAIIQEVRELVPCYDSWVCITGGEPLYQESELEKLVLGLKEEDYKVSIETNGSYEPPKWWSMVDSWVPDIKCPSSGVCGLSKDKWLLMGRMRDQIKFVVGIPEDLDFVVEKLRHGVLCTVLVSPVFTISESDGNFSWDPSWAQIVWEFCRKMGVQFSLQTHKVVFGNKVGV